MAPRNLTARIMIAISAIWLDPKHDRRKIENNPTLRVVLEQLEEAHNALVTTHKRAGTIEQVMRLLTEELGNRDNFHDSLGRGIYHLLTGLAERSRDPARAARYLELRDMLLPFGLSVLRRSYQEQAGAAEQIRARLTPEIRAELAAIHVEDQTLLDDVETWLDEARIIGEKFAERAQLGVNEDDAVRDRELHNARLAWIRAVNFFQTLAEHAELDPIERRALFAPLDQALRRVRNAANQSGNQPDDEPLLIEPVAETTVDATPVTDDLPESV